MDLLFKIINAKYATVLLLLNLKY